MMNYLKGIAAGAVLLFATSASAQQPGTATSSQASDEQTAMHARVMAADAHLKVLLTSLNLTADQQSTVIRILFELQDETMRIVENQNLSHDEQLTRIKSLRSMAHSHMYASLSDDQKKTFDDFMRAPHE